MRARANLLTVIFPDAVTEAQKGLASLIAMIQRLANCQNHLNSGCFIFSISRFTLLPEGLLKNKEVNEGQVTKSIQD